MKDTGVGVETCRLVRNPAVLWRRTAAGTALLPPGLPEPVILQGTAAATWELLDTPTTAGELAVLLSQVFEVDGALIEAQMAPFLQHLRDIGAVLDP